MPKVYYICMSIGNAYVLNSIEKVYLLGLKQAEPRG